MTLCPLQNLQYASPWSCMSRIIAQKWIGHSWDCRRFLGGDPTHYYEILGSVHTYADAKVRTSFCITLRDASAHSLQTSQKKYTTPFYYYFIESHQNAWYCVTMHFGTHVHTLRWSATKKKWPHRTSAKNTNEFVRVSAMYTFQHGCTADEDPVGRQKSWFWFCNMQW